MADARDLRSLSVLYPFSVTSWAASSLIRG